MAIPEGYSKLAKIGISYKGDYVEGATYEQLDAVFYAGSTYIAMIDNPIGFPTNDKVNWRYLAEGAIQELGTTDISDIADGTVKGAIRELADNPADASLWLSQDEYDALSEEEQNNGTEYQIYDSKIVMKNGVLIGGDFSTADRIKYDETKNVKKKIEEMDEKQKTGTQSLNDAYSAIYCKSGNVVTVYFSAYSITGITSNTVIEVGTLPEGFRPLATTRERNYKDGIIAECGADGKVKLYVDNAETYENILLSKTFVVE